jgi:eukaryotic-like serine/threonine-protein kinase
MSETAQRYKVLERIDAGGMAEVFKGTVTSIQGFDKLVAIKRILPDLTQDMRFVRMFLDEAKLSLHLNHNNIVQTFDIGNADGTYFIVMEFVDGANLKDLLNWMLQQGRRIPPEMAVFIAMQVCKGLTYAHELKSPDGKALGVVHRDISPPNILISKEGEVKITDFGLAKAVIQLERTDPGIVKGKFGYLSPEAAYGEDVDPRTDLFAVGIVLWEMMAGKRLFLGKTDLETLEYVRRARVPSLRQINPEIPERLDEIVAQMLAKDKTHRFANARDLGSELAKFLFAQGKSITSYDLSSLVVELIETRTERPVAPVKDGGIIDILIQNEIDKFISVEEMADLNELNLVGAQPLMVEDFHRDDTGSELPQFGFEDPRTWSDVVGDDEGSLEFSVDQQPAARTPAATPPATAPDTPRLPATPSPRAPATDGAKPAANKAVWIAFITLLVLLVCGLLYLIVNLAVG